MSEIGRHRFQRKQVSWLLQATSVMVIAVIAACASDETTAKPDTNIEAEVELPSSSAPGESAPFCTLPTFGVLPPPPKSNQPSVDCSIWQTFIALNAQADPANPGKADPNATPATFGDPADMSPSVWQTYAAPGAVFLAGAQKPGAWGTQQPMPPACANSAAGADQGLAVLAATSKFGTEELDEELQAFTNAELVDQTAAVVRYERRFNETEFDYIVDNGLYDGDKQAAFAKSNGIVLPTDSVELKAAWRILDGQPAEVQARYKKTSAMLYEAATNTCRGPVTMGLIGLHIIRKTDTMKQWIWATFEHIDNLANPATPSTIHPTLTDPACTPTACPVNQKPVKGQPVKPTQVSRVNPMPKTIDSENATMQALIKSANEDSVFQYYQLIDSLWPKATPPDPNPGDTVPIPINKSGFTSNTGGKPLANVSMETYVQTASCTACHVGGEIAPSQAVGCNPKPAADFTFVFNDADTADGYRAKNCK